MKPYQPCIYNVLDLHQNDSTDRTSFDELVSTLNANQARVYERVKSHLKHQLMHEKNGASVMILNHCTYLSVVWEVQVN